MFAKRHARFLLSGAALLIAALLFCALDSRLILRRYALSAPQLTSPVRIALVTDLHSCRYGENQRELAQAIRGAAPDLLLIAGDYFDDEIADTNAELLLAQILDLCPIYYVTGNHECYSGSAGFAQKMEILEKYGARRLAGDCALLELGGARIAVCGVDDPSIYMVSDGADSTQQLAQAAAAAQDSDYSILLAHRPERIGDYAEYGFDLALCGHAHGGQMRIPLLLNGLYAPNQGFFPKYAGGEYRLGDTMMIVSRGLARESTRLPRIFNRPELVLIELGGDSVLTAG